MKKSLIAMVLCFALCLLALAGGAEAAFTDISDPEMATAAAVLQGLGIVSGTSSTTFEPDGTLTRAELCTMTVNAMGLSGQVSTYSRRTLFSDVPASAWYNGYVNLAASEGVISGYGDGTFGPDDPVTYGQAATILLHLLDYTSAEVGSVWPQDYTSYCDALGLSDGLGLTAYQSITRGQAAVLLYRTIKQTMNGSQQAFYETIDGVASTADAILLETGAEHGGSTGLLMTYSLSGTDGLAYYSQSRTQSEVLEGSMGTLLLNSAGQVMGFVPEDGDSIELTIADATASVLTAQDGTEYRISSGAIVVSGGESTSYSTSGYLELDSRAGRTARLYRDADGAVICIYLAGGTLSTSDAAVAETTSAASSLARALGITNKTYTITKNGAAATEDDLARYDVGYYDAAAGVLCVSDYRLTGYLTNASPNVTAAETVTVAGCTVEVLECAWDTLGSMDLGDRVTLLLTDDGKVAAAYSSSRLSAEMIGVLAEDGRSVTLCDSGLTLSADTMSYDESSLGGLVRVQATSATALSCHVPSRDGAKIDLAANTLGSRELAPSCAIYEWAGTGYVYDLEGSQGQASSDLSAIDWTDSISASAVSYYRVNEAGQVDVILLESVTGNCYEYGRLTLYPDEAGINLGTSGMDAYNSAATLTNSSGTSEKYLCTIASSTNGYVGIVLGQTDYGYQRVYSIQKLTRSGTVTSDDFFTQDGNWYAECGIDEVRISDKVQIYLSGSGLWLEGTEGLETVLADGYVLTAYIDRAASSGGQVRLLVADGSN